MTKPFIVFPFRRNLRVKSSEPTIFQAGIWMYSLYYITFILTLVLNISLLGRAVQYARSKSRSIQKPLLTTLCISLLFMLGWTLYMAWISMMVYLRWLVETGRPIDGPRYRTIFKWLEFSEYFLYTISSWGNSVIYVMINRRFRKLLFRGTVMVKHGSSALTGK